VTARAGPADLGLTRRIEALVGAPVAHLAPLGGGCIAEVWRVDFADPSRPPLVAKLDAEGRLAVEGWMLDYLARCSTLPVPRVVHCDDRLLLIDHIAHDGRLGADGERHCAELIAALHDVTAPRFGLARDTVIGPLAQPNPESDDWIAFFRDQRLLAMGRRALEAGALPPAVLARLEAFAARLGDFIPGEVRPSLLHGDLWAGNILADRGRIAGFVDPAIYCGDAEVDLAFATLFGSLGEAFFARYRELRPLAPGFFEARRDIYNLYPLLVHATLFGGGYGAAVARILERYG